MNDSALTTAYRLQKSASHPELDWKHIDAVLIDVREEIQELAAAGTPEEKMAELGDLLFVIVNWGRWAGISDPEAALEAANRRFSRRLGYLQETAAQTGKPLHEWTIDQLRQVWEEAKSRVG